LTAFSSFVSVGNADDAVAMRLLTTLAVVVEVGANDGDVEVDVLNVKPEVPPDGEGVVPKAGVGEAEADGEGAMKVNPDVPAPGPNRTGPGLCEECWNQQATGTTIENSRLKLRKAVLVLFRHRSSLFLADHAF
jgi:hypothetical protein